MSRICSGEVAQKDLKNYLFQEVGVISGSGSNIVKKGLLIFLYKEGLL